MLKQKYKQRKKYSHTSKILKSVKNMLHVPIRAHRANKANIKQSLQSVPKC